MTVIAPNLILFVLVAVVVVVVVVVVVAATHSSTPPPPSPPLPPQRLSSPALSELDLRYARGEIERDEYLRRRSDILGQ
jgi:putative membrane protein